MLHNSFLMPLATFPLPSAPIRSLLCCVFTKICISLDAFDRENLHPQSSKQDLGAGGFSSHRSRRHDRSFSTHTHTHRQTHALSLVQSEKSLPSVHCSAVQIWIANLFSASSRNEMAKRSHSLRYFSSFFPLSFTLQFLLCC